MGKILLEKSCLAGQSNIFEEQIATGTSAYIFAGKAVHSDPDFISIADKSLKEKSGYKKIRDSFLGESRSYFS